MVLASVTILARLSPTCAVSARCHRRSPATTGRRFVMVRPYIHLLLARGELLDQIEEDATHGPSAPRAIAREHAPIRLGALRAFHELEHLLCAQCDECALNRGHHLIHALVQTLRHEDGDIGRGCVHGLACRCERERTLRRRVTCAPRAAVLLLLPTVLAQQGFKIRALLHAQGRICRGQRCCGAALLAHGTQGSRHSRVSCAAAVKVHPRGHGRMGPLLACLVHARACGGPVALRLRRRFEGCA
mmetsp:Transcript_20530/g.55248  ORF Transcript_20530/g.55248 Transcript_20530/m.55248 type:complete len:245 (+) Transcript_20530:1048-1782(+)